MASGQIHVPATVSDAEAASSLLDDMIPMIGSANGQLLIKTGTISQKANATSGTVNMGTYFPTSCFYVAIYNSQIGFGANDCIGCTITNETNSSGVNTSKFTYIQRNAASASMSMTYVAFGY